MNDYVRRIRLAALLPLAAACASGGSSRASAVEPRAEPLAPGATVTGRLAAGDPAFRDGAHYRRYDFTAAAGDTLTFTLHADDFDAYLIVTDRFGNPQARNDDGGGECDARLIYVARDSGAHRLLATSSARGEVGTYRLSSIRGTVEAPEDTACAGFGPIQGAIQAGQSITAELTDHDAMLGDSSHYQAWMLTLAPGEKVTIDLQSDAFDAFLVLKRGRNETVLQNDDGGRGCNSRIVYTATDDRPIRVLANTVRPRVTGTFTLRVTSGGMPIDPKGNCTATPGGVG